MATALRGLRWGILLSLPTLTLALLWWTRPAPQILSQYSTSLQARSSEQWHNIQQAAQALDGTYLQPGEIFSFNGVVGPRTLIRGYRSAPAFMIVTTVESVGGGICQVSSSLYNAALRADLTVVERHAHYTTIASVPPGRDATVWYDQVDLKLQNPHPWPIQIQAQIRSQRLIIAIAGQRSLPDPPSLRTQQQHLDPNHLQVWLYRDDQQVSQDIYRISSPQETSDPH